MIKLKINNLVKFKEVIEPGDSDARFIVNEILGDRVKVTAINTGMNIAPTFTYMVSEVIPCES